MNKLFFIMLVTLLSIGCSKLDNPFDEKAQNFVSSQALSNLIKSSDSTFIDTQVITKTIIKFDTVIHDSIRITQKTIIDTVIHIDTISSIHTDTTVFTQVIVHDSIVLLPTLLFDTISVFDTSLILDSIHFLDTITLVDTTVITDTTHLFDTLHVSDTTHFLDTIHFKDTIHYLDTVVFIDTMHFSDTVHFKDTTIFKDTLHFKDTTHLFIRDTIRVFDTTHVKDTIHFRDTIIHVDTLIHRDTVVDTVYYFKHNPFMYLITVPDSLQFCKGNWGQNYKVRIKAAGINPSLIKGYSARYAYTGWNWFSADTGWLHSFKFQSGDLLDLRILTDSGTFACKYGVAVEANSLIKFIQPKFVFNITSVGCDGYSKKIFDYSPLLEFWCDSFPFSSKKDTIEIITFEYVFVVDRSVTKYQQLYSTTGSYDPAKCETTYNNAMYQEFNNVKPGSYAYTAKVRVVAPDTSLWSDWLTIPYIVHP